MKSATLATLVAAFAAQTQAQGLLDMIGGLGLTPSSLSGLTGILPANMLTGVAGSFVTSLNKGYGLTSSPPGAAPMRQNIAARFPKEIPGSKSVKIRYGPYKVPNMNKKNGLGEAGSLWNYPHKDVAKPCDKCIVVGMNADLEYADGSNANIDTDAWLHHFVLFNQGSGRVDATCTGKGSLPHANVGATADNSERMFSSGNERTPAFLSSWTGEGAKTKPVGYHLKQDDRFHLIVDLMNDGMQDKVLYLIIYFDYVDGHPAEFDTMKPVWFDIDQCGLSEMSPPKQTGAFTVSAKTWYATMDGEILGYAGHLHDGGVRVNLLVEGKNACKSEATYGGSKEYISRHNDAGMSGGHSDSATVHISKMGICQGNTLAQRQMKRGQAWQLTADYDYDAHKGVKHGDGGQADIMGIAIMYVRQPFKGFGW